MQNILTKFFFKTISKGKLEKIFSYLENLYPDGQDPWGLNLKKTKVNFAIIWPFYKSYFKTRVFGKKNVPNGPVMVISNHSGQIAIDGMLISSAFVGDIWPPRILRPMVERFFTNLPFVGNWAAEGGAALGDRQNCEQLLQRKQSVLVFPEGVKGVAKSTPDYYKLQKFTRGFLRIAIKTKTEILPIAVIGAEEFYPFVYQAKKLAKLLGFPALPLSPSFILGPIGFIPLPSPVDIHIGKPYTIPENLTHKSTDRELDIHIDKIHQEIKDLLKMGLKKRRKFWANQK